MIFVDMDGVIVDFVRGSLLRWNIDIDKMPFEERKKLGWSYWEHFGFETEQFWEEIREGGEDFWANLPLYSWSLDFLDYIRAVADATDQEWALLSSPSRDPRSLSGKVLWMQKHIDPLFRDYLLVPAGHKKQMAKGNILIDDHDQNVEDWIEAGGKAVMFPQTWNQMKNFADRPIAYVTGAIDFFCE